MKIPISDLASVGLRADEPPTEIPLQAWTDVRNMRFKDGAVEKLLGHAEQLGAPNTPPRWLLSASQGGTAFWLYASDTKVGATDGAVHADITRTSANYTVSPTSGWTGYIIEDIPVINNGIDVPQMWKKPALSQKLADLSGWPSGVTCNALRGLKRYLIALDVNKSGVRFPTLIKWSHQAPTGDVPTSWDENRDDIDAAEYSLPGEGGFLVDGQELRDVLMLYKEYETWQMQYVGGIDIFRFTRVFQSVGAIARRCVVEFFSGKHLVFTGDDIVLHDGHQAKSLASKRIRTLVANTMDPKNFSAAFVVVDYASNEVWVCIPEVGSTTCTLAFIWNWLQDTWAVRALPQVLYASNGIVNPQSVGETWDGATGVWDSFTKAWGDRVSDPTKRKMLMASNIGAGALLTPHTTHQFSGASFTAYVERRGMGFPLGKDRSGEYPPDYSRMKQVVSLWPRISGTPNGTVSVTLGTQTKADSPVVWGAPRSYIIGVSDRLDFSGSSASKIHAIRFESADQTFWRLHGYDVEVLDRGER